MKPNASHKPNHDPSPSEIAAMAKQIRDENEAAIMAKAPKDSYTVRPLELRAARIGN